jgi:elongation factor G
VGDPDQAGRRGPLPEGRARGRDQRDRDLRPGRAAPAHAARALREVYKFEVDTRPPRIAYRETVTAPAEGHHRHKKQTGGAGQFGEVFLRIEPLPRGAGFEFVDEVKGGTIPGQFIPAVEKGVREVLATAPSPATRWSDVRVIVYDGKHHSVDSKEIAFVTAGKQGLHGAIREGAADRAGADRHIEITAPDHAMGDITGDLSSSAAGHRHRQRRGGSVVIKGQVPMSELAGYQSRLNALTSGPGPLHDRAVALRAGAAPGAAAAPQRSPSRRHSTGRSSGSP